MSLVTTLKKKQNTKQISHQLKYQNSFIKKHLSNKGTALHEQVLTHLAKETSWNTVIADGILH